MKIAILTLGTRGDVQPYAVLGRALKERGHAVTLATAKNFESLVLSYGIHFEPVEADYQEVLNTPEGKKMMKANPLAIQRNLEKWVYPLIENSLDTFYHIAKDADLVLYHVKSLSDTFADQFSEKMIKAMVVPVIEPTKAFANPAFSGVYFPKFFNRFTYKLTDLSMKTVTKPVKRFRLKNALPEKFTKVSTPILYGISKHFLSEPNDFSSQSYFSGFWKEASQMPLSADLQHFLTTGEKPLLVTFGSMPFTSKLNLEKALLHLVQTENIRVIVMRGWGVEKTENWAQHPMIFVAESAPFDTLFPKVKAAIHHGGIGTTATCLQAGIPFWVCPVLYPVGDQQFWGNLAFEKGLALKPIPLKKVSESVFIKNAIALMKDESLATNAKEMGEKLSQEFGLNQAVTWIEEKMNNLKKE
ncbi:MAG: glycosyltransferase [Bacteroidia bacterium]|nr:glycosyltransferase [Bacteroidia bacterium]MCF8426670.1 glycosyltransferase [Bacteroidia bacterium]MCF8446725.1 glycosyltransferase [Bacteroidia bacterium]